MFGKIYGVTFLALMVIAPSARAQTGLYPFGSFDTVGVDTIDRGSLNVHIEIPVVAKQGRGVPFQYTLVYDGLVWTPVGSSGSQTWTPAVGFGLHGQFNEGYEGYISYASAVVRCTLSGTLTYVPYDFGYLYHDQFGVSHALPYTFNSCGSVTTGASTPAKDGSGYVYNGSALLSRDGKFLDVPLNSQSASGSLTDTNGNVVTNNGNGTFTDTLGKTALTIAGSGTPSSAKTFTYSTPTGTQAVTVTYTAYTVQTAFGCSGVTEYNLAQDLPNTITLADGSVYTFGYEKTPGASSHVTGRVASVTPPQGGAITYSYTGANSGINCADGTPTGLTRSGDVGRTYVRSSITATSSHTDITDGLGNDSGFDFVKAGGGAFYETNRTVHQGSSTGPVLLSRQTCYNASANPCTATAITLPVAQIDTYETLNGIQQHGSTLTYNSYGLQTAQTDYDFGGASARGSALRKETWAYPSSGIVSLVSSDTVTDGSNNQIGLTSYAYDETTGPGHAALVTTSGVPQHNAVNGQRGNLTTINASSGTGASVSTASAYEDTGNPVTVTTPNGATTYAYDPPTHGFTVKATPPTPSSGVSLPSSATYDPNSGLPLTAVDPNNQTVTFKTYDALLRPTEIDYPDGGKMIAAYTPDQTGAGLYIKAGVHTNTQTNYGTYGKVNWVAVQNASGGYYWNNYCYDGNGNVQYAAYRFASGAPSFARERVTAILTMLWGAC